MLDGLKRQHARLWTVRPNASLAAKYSSCKALREDWLEFRPTEQQKVEQTSFANFPPARLACAELDNYSDESRHEHEYGHSPNRRRY
jgi:hypothetical protein